MDSIIKTENLSKHYSDVKAVSELNLHVGKGEIYGFLGLNGAGKTTTIRMLLGLIRPTSGSAYITNKKVNPGHHELWNKIGYLVEIPYSYPNLTVRENLEIIRHLRFIKDRNSTDKIIKDLQLEPYKNRKAKHLSQGNAQRLGLAKALIHQPEILILDEPANGLDPAGISDIREMFIDLARNNGVTIFISSHILSEISKFATRIGIIHQGKMVQEIDTQQLEILRKKYLLVGVKDIKSAFSIIQQKGYNSCELKDNIIKIWDEVAIDKPEEISSLLGAAGHPPSRLLVEEENLESYFLRAIKMNGGEK